MAVGRVMRASKRAWRIAAKEVMGIRLRLKGVEVTVKSLPSSWMTLNERWCEISFCGNRLGTGFRGVKKQYQFVTILPISGRRDEGMEEMSDKREVRVST